jgi:Tfp pilus assembly protein PilV
MNPGMRAPLRDEDGFLMLELLAAIVVISLAILALMATYDAAFVSLHKAAQNTAASTLAQNQLELYSALSYSSIGLDSASLTTAKANTTYAADEAALTTNTGVTATDATLAAACSSTQCLPIQTLTGSDRKSYTVETFIRNLTSASYSGRAEREVAIVVRDPSTTGSPTVARMTAAFDAGPS